MGKSSKNCLKNMNNFDKQSNTVLRIAVAGVIAVSFIAFLSFVNDRRGENDVDAPSEEEVEGVVEETPQFVRDGYGIKFDYSEDSGYEIVENPKKTDDHEIVDCRKMSTSLRESLIEEKHGICYEVVIYLSPDSKDSFIAIATGNKAFDGIPRGHSVAINLPVERMSISNFPTNMQGTKYVYKDSEDIVFYSGVVYKGADKYAILIKGDIDDRVTSLLETVDLE